MKHSKQWTKKIYDTSFQNDVIQNYLLYKSIKKVSGKHNITTRQVINILNDNQISHQYIRKIKLDEQYFDRYIDHVDSAEVMYWVGFIAADGNVINKSKSRSYFLTINLGVKDENHLYKIQSCLQSNAKITRRINKGGFRTGKLWKDSIGSVIVFNSKYLVNSLHRFNIVPAKSNIYDFPEILTNNININSFVRGYFDGDGSISFKNGYLRLNFYGTFNFLEKLGKIINKNCNVSIHHPFKNRTIYNLEYNGKEAIILVKWLYHNINERIVLDRKYETIKHLLER